MGIIEEYLKLDKKKRFKKLNEIAGEYIYRDTYRLSGIIKWTSQEHEDIVNVRLAAMEQSFQRATKLEKLPKNQYQLSAFITKATNFVARDYLRKRTQAQLHITRISERFVDKTNVQENNMNAQHSKELLKSLTPEELKFAKLIMKTNTLKKQAEKANKTVWEVRKEKELLKIKLSK